MTQRTEVAQMEVREAGIIQAAPKEEVWVTHILCASVHEPRGLGRVSEALGTGLGQVCQDSFSIYSSRPLFNHCPFCFRPAGGAQLWTPKPH